jgi:uncharacterized membrane protein
MSTSADRLVDDYLDRLERELAGFPPARRRELVQEISEHIAEARAGLETENEAEIRNPLDRTGDPADIAAEARGPVEEQPATAAPAAERRSGAFDVVALVLLLLGGVVVPVVGWLVGVVLLWISSAWTARQKLLGTLVVPGGLALPAGILLLVTFESTCYQQPIPGSRDQMICSSGSTGGQILGSIVVALLGAASIATVIYLGRRMGRNAEMAAA